MGGYHVFSDMQLFEILFSQKVAVKWLCFDRIDKFAKVSFVVFIVLCFVYFN